MPTTPDPQWVNQYDTPTLGLIIYIQGVPADPDGGAVTVMMIDNGTRNTLFLRPATRADAGSYQIALTSADTVMPGDYTLRWNFTANGVADYYETGIEVGVFSPDYAALSVDMQDIIEQSWNRFEDLFDSPFGGPNLQTYRQTHFTRNRLAQLLRIAVGRLNTISQPYMTYTVDGNGGAVFPIAQWGPLLEKALYVETLKHLRRSYLEQPALMGGDVTRVDRRDYFDRWGQVLQEEEADLKNQLDTFKIRNMFLGKPQVLVGGGVFGRYGPTRYAGSAAARPRFLWQAFYSVLIFVGMIGACLTFPQNPSQTIPQPIHSMVSMQHQ